MPGVAQHARWHVAREHVTRQRIGFSTVAVNGNGALKKKSADRLPQSRRYCVRTDESKPGNKAHCISGA
jgi:hypothetical protein